MLSFVDLLFLATVLQVPLTLAQFLYPPQGDVFSIGETETIKWHTTFPNFTVALWQQALVGGSASVGPILLQITHDGSEVEQFDWVVQTYGLDLQVSNKFFFWLIQGDASQQGNQSAPGLTSPYFNITEQSSVSSSSASPRSTTTTSADSSKTSSTNPAASSSTAGGSGSSKGLSTGAVAGIAVGTSCVGIAAILGVIYCIMRLRKTQKKLAAQLEQQNARLNQQYNPHDQSASPQQVTTAREPPNPIQKGNDRNLGPVELG